MDARDDGLGRLLGGGRRGLAARVVGVSSRADAPVNRSALDALADVARAYGRAYVRLKDQLLREGVRREEAIATARATAMMAAMMPEDSTRCPLCDR